jgi:hypothetical protein
MSAYMVVGPTKRNPSLRSDRLIASDLGVSWPGPRANDTGAVAGAAARSPEHLVERLVEGERGTRVLDRGLDLAAVADDARVAEEALDVGLGHGGDLLGVEAVEHLAERRSAAEDRDPGQARLEPLEAHLLEEAHRIVLRGSPLLIVVAAVLGVVRAPRAPREAVVAR